MHRWAEPLSSLSGQLLSFLETRGQIICSELLRTLIKVREYAKQTMQVCRLHQYSASGCKLSTLSSLLLSYEVHAEVPFATVALCVVAPSSFTGDYRFTVSWLAFLLLIRKLRGINLSTETGYCKVFHDFPQSLQENARTVP